MLKKQKKYSIVDIEKRKLIYLIIPALLLYLVFIVYPSIRAFAYSFTDWSGFNLNPIFIGVKNFVELFGDPKFLVSFKNSIVIFIVGGIIIFAIAFLFSSFSSGKAKGKKFYRAIIFMPFILQPVAVTTIWGFLTNPSFGLINIILNKIGLGILAKPWMSPDYIFGLVVFVIIWVNVGFYLVIFLSAIGKIPKHLFESAKIEGANQFQIFTKITIPLIYDVIIVAFVFWGVVSIKMFELVYSFTGNLARPELYTVPVYVYAMGFGGGYSKIFRLGYASSMALVLFLIIIVFVVLLRYLTNKRETIEY